MATNRDSTAKTSALGRGLMLGGLLLAGAVLLGAGKPEATDFLAGAVAAALAGVVLIPPVREGLGLALERMARPSARMATITGLAIWVATTAYVILSAMGQGWDLAPRLHDEYSYLLQARMLAEGRLWMPAHPLADFFESFHILVRPVYASLYFPGAALLYAPGIWLGLPVWAMPAVISGAAAALLYRVAGELIDGIAGLLAAVMLVALGDFRTMAVSVMSQPVMLLTALLAWWAYVRWRSARQLRFAALLGLAAGWLMITRPIDGLCWLAPLGVAMLLDLRGQRAREWIAALGVAAVAAVGPLSLQIIQNVGVTGRWSVTPHAYYSRLDMPQMVYGFAEFDPEARPASMLLQKQLYYEQFMVPIIRDHRPDRLVHVWLNYKLPILLIVTLPGLVLVILLPAAMRVMKQKRRWALLAVLPMFVGLYALFPYLLSHYALAAAPAAIVGVLLGVEAVAGGSKAARLYLLALVTILSVMALPELGGRTQDMTAPPLRAIDDELERNVHRPAVVLFTFHPESSFHVEPVYNIDSAWPDDAPIVRAHDLGEARNAALIAYYAKNQPERTIYIYDRREESLRELGTARELAEGMKP